MSTLGAALRKAAPKSPRPVARTLTLPAPMGSINTASSGMAMPPEDCVFRFNMIPAEYGNRSRLGSREHLTGLDGEVRCMMPFTAQVSSSNRLFATTQTGIWDITASAALSDTTNRLVEFGTQDATSGHGSWACMVSNAGHFLVYCDEANGAYLWTESTATWAALSVTGVSAANLVGVCAWKNRLWFVERNTGKGWYLPTNAIGGAATAFYFGARFRAGGELRCMASWTYDGGAGIDDSLVVVSSAGDVLVYQGTDPSTVGAFSLRGAWSVPGVPAGRRLLSDFGGDLLVMSRTGLVPMSLLTSGNAGQSTQYATAKLANKWNRLMLTRAGFLGWQMVQHPLDATMIVIVPQGASLDSEQLVMSLNGRQWSEYRGLEMGLAACAYEGTLYYGNKDGKIRIMDGDTDGRTLAAPTTTTAIEWSLLGAFSDLGVAGKKRLSLVEPLFYSDTSAPVYAVQARYDFDLNEATEPATSAASGDPSTWDTGEWDSAIWGSDYMASSEVRGVVGMGRHVAIAIRGSSVCRTVLQGYTITYDVGGVL